MKHSCACVFLLLLTLCLTGCGLSFQDFSAPDGSYTVKMPGKPIRSAASSAAQGESWEVLTGNWAFTAGSIAPPFTNQLALDAAKQNLALDMLCQGMATSTRGTMKSAVPTTLNGFPGREATYSLPAGTAISGKMEPASTAVMRFYLTNSKIYILAVRCKNDITKDTSEVKTFFDSFKLNESAPSSVAMAGMPGGVPAAGTALPAPGTTPAVMPLPEPSNSAVLPMPGASSGFTATPEPAPALPPPGAAPLAGTNSMPLAAANPAPGSVPGQGFTPLAVNPNGGTPGQTGSTPQYTGTPITPETKLIVGDAVQVYYNNQWVDAKVTRVSPNGGVVQVRSLTKPPVWEVVPRNIMQKVGSPDAPQVASNDAPLTDPSGLPNSTAASGFANPSDSGLPNTKAASKSRSSGLAKSAGESKPETTKSAGGVSLDGASVDDLIRIIGKKGEHRKVQAAERLRDHSEAGPNPEVAKKIVDLLKTDELIVRGAVAQALEKWASPEIQDAVVKNMTGGTTEVRQSMIRIMAASNAEDAADRIAQNLTDKDDRKVATEALVGLGEPAQGAVIKMLNHRDSKVKTAACEILQQIGSADAITALTKATSDWTGTDRLAARKALKTLEAKK